MKKALVIVTVVMLLATGSASATVIKDHNHNWKHNIHKKHNNIKVHLFPKEPFPYYECKNIVKEEVIKEEVVSVPEPSTVSLLALGLGFLGFIRYIRPVS